MLSDINMPGINGLELLKTVKEKYPQIRVSMIHRVRGRTEFRNSHVDRGRTLLYKADRFRSDQERHAELHMTCSLLSYV